MYAPLPSDVATKLSKFLPLILPLTGILITGILLPDLISPLGRVVWLLYCLPLFLTFWFSHRQYLIPIATVCMALIIVGFIHTSPGISMEPGSFQPILAVVVLWITTFLLRQHKEAEEALQNADDQLELPVEGNAFAARSPTRRCSAPSAGSKG
ncbi:MAG: hypothetical protein E6K69_00640 [Nitrospirae bacterium]|nr:MAG: hypothetical protein E6K69_00640 [Nitrospirota bacterium]